MAFVYMTSASDTLHRCTTFINFAVLAESASLKHLMRPSCVLSSKDYIDGLCVVLWILSIWHKIEAFRVL